MIAFDSVSELMNMCYVAPMGNTSCHGGYVWAAYAFAILVIGLNIFVIRHRRKKIVKLIQRKNRIRQAAS